MAFLNAKDLRREYDLDPKSCIQRLSEAMDRREITLDVVSIRDLAEGFLGEDIVRAMENRKSGGMLFREANSAVDTTAFSNITGQLLVNRVKDEYKLWTDISDALCTTSQTKILNGEKIPGIGGIGDEAEVVDEARPYPEVGLSEEYVLIPPLEKRGFIVSVTREIIIADLTGQLLRQAGRGGEWLGINKMKRIIDVAVGATNTYNRNGTATNTYLTSGAYINSAGNTMVDWTDFENAMLLFDAITDPNTGEPIMWGGELTALVPTALAMTTARVVNATDIRFGDGASNTTATYGKNPLSGQQIAIVTNPYVKLRSGSASTWFFGNFKRAFGYAEAWGIETSQAPATGAANFERDIEQRYKVSEMGVAFVEEPRLVIKNT